MKALALVLCLAGCASHLVWHGKSPDRRHDVRVIDYQGQYIVVDGVRGPKFTGIAVGAMAFSPNSTRLAYAAQQSNVWHMVVDRKVGPAFSGFGTVQFSPDSSRIAYAGQRGKAWHVVIDGQVGPPFDSLFANTMLFSRDSQRFAYVGQRGDRVYVVVDGAVGNGYAGIGNLQFSPDGQHVAYVGRRNDSDAAVVLDNAEGQRYGAIQSLTFAPDGRVAFAALSPDGWHAVIGGEVSARWDLVRGIAFSADGQHAAYIARRTQGDTRVVIDGVESKSYTGARPASLMFATGDARPTYIAMRGAGYFVVHADVEGPLYDDVTPPVFSRNGARWAYVATFGDHQSLVVDGVEGPRADGFADLAFSADGNRFAYVERNRASARVVVDGKALDYDVVLGGTLVVSDTGEHWGCIIGDRNEEKFYMLVDGRRYALIDIEETIDLATQARASGRAAPSDRSLRDWVAAEIANQR